MPPKAPVLANCAAPLLADLLLTVAHFEQEIELKR